MDEATVTDRQVHAVPQSYVGRNRLRGIIDAFVNSRFSVPPLPMSELSAMADELIRRYDLSKAWKGWLMVEINNCAWADTVAAVPYNKRILLLPQCLADKSQCRAETDEMGLLCMKCNSCSISPLLTVADELGMMSLVAEGFTAVMGLLESGAVHTVIGVGCLDSLEKVFPLLVDRAVPGIAVPLNRAGCRNTHVDRRYVEKYMRRYHPVHRASLHYETIKRITNEWFAPESLTEYFNGDDNASVIAREWLSGEGNRRRPFILAAVYLGISGKKEIPESVRQAAIAVECFHKASLVHDDIQDNDEFRYGKQTVHARHGVATAINVGDLLLGEGYRLLSQCGHPELVSVAAAAHVSLCKGQGMELAWSREPQELTLPFVLEIFRHKTVPAFEAAMHFGLCCAGDDEQLRFILHEYALALGIAYQLRDDAEDYARPDTRIALRPSAVLAVLCECYCGMGYMARLRRENDIKAFLERDEHRPQLLKAVRKVNALSEEYHRRAINALRAIKNPEMKRLLFHLTARMLKA
ncbi:MAG: polyprenyl synthetase family protein [Tannerella sp.]|jgi:geranylgeranyl pyrophosphate synthase|nr:polyprenyl synthetase family protein [Tannerella sp.]